MRLCTPISNNFAPKSTPNGRGRDNPRGRGHATAFVGGWSVTSPVILEFYIPGQGQSPWSRICHSIRRGMVPDLPVILQFHTPGRDNPRGRGYATAFVGGWSVTSPLYCNSTSPGRICYSVRRGMVRDLPVILQFHIRVFVFYLAPLGVRGRLFPRHNRELLYCL